MSQLTERLEQVTHAYWERWAQAELDRMLAGPSPFWKRFEEQHSLDPEWRYRHKSRQGRPHEFSYGDAKAVLRQVRHGHKVSCHLFDQAIAAIKQEGYDRGYEDGADAGY